uniref:Uncharacterized protein n=1 Tax=Molossus molossus TaxID=27622 RepID=A0A7J8BYK4_MOLMO|nr:hypothetical protein HJG59_010068 [Molossus molossus]
MEENSCQGSPAPGHPSTEPMSYSLCQNLSLSCHPTFSLVSKHSGPEPVCSNLELAQLLCHLPAVGTCACIWTTASWLQLTWEREEERQCLAANKHLITPSLLILILGASTLTSFLPTSSAG